ncbi:MAG: helix-turn-helix domain-containing protein, partial [Candidatus Brocadiales bacterium]
AGELKDIRVPSAYMLDIDYGLPFKEAKRRMVDAFERQFINRSLDEHSGNVTHAANALGMHRQVLQQKIRELKLRERGD